MKKLFGILLLFLSTIYCQGQSVGLVLSGGGARGTAHIGVIKALEDNNIPIDYIVGTSAGAIVGALYASGYTVEEIADIFSSGVLESYFMPMKESKKGYLIKEMPHSPKWLNMKFKVDSVIQSKFIPTSIIPPHAMDFGFVEFFAEASTACNNNFDNLMIPFRSVASSINENKEYVISKGDLGLAVRASMSFPFFFSPIEIDGKVLMDGGMYNNFPVSVMEEQFNPGVLIGSTVSSNYKEADKHDAIGIVQNIFMINMNFDMPENGILIRPELEDVSLLDFSYTNQFIDSGYNATMKNIELIKSRITTTQTKEELRTKRNTFEQKKQPLFFKDVHAKNVNKRQAAYIDHLMLGNRDFLSVNEVRDKYNILVADENIYQASPTAVYNDSTGFYDLILDVETEMNFEAEIGGHISWGGVNEAYIGLLHRYLDRFSINSRLNGYFGTFYRSIGLYSKIDYPSKILIYGILDASLNQKNYFTTSNSLYSDASPSYLQQTEQHVLIQAGVPIGERSTFGIKAAFVYTNDKFYNTNYFTKNDTADNTHFSGLATGVVFERNTFNNYFYPDFGMSLKISANFNYGKETFHPGTTSFQNERSIGYHSWFTLSAVYEQFVLNKKYISLGFYLQAELSNDKLWSNYMSTLLHAKGFEPFQDSKLRFLPEYRSNNFGVAGLKCFIKLPYQFIISLEAYSYTPVFPINHGENQQGVFGKFYERTNYMASAGIIFRNNVVPIGINFNIYDNKDTPFTISFSIGHLMFNRYALD
ncbi:patatin-like phospholipase family protein [Bacteroidales bacterium OttesenSCG-928-K03]|nr:patatin-like phospholipase family protein [Odoribacter sp. OttesenSCG-928-L07]MDL2239257.1 patatin-like phospholipase family protein [Bacteroidales bacterium OttesenSCG-928-L14]MDL2242377.1 patatin-like phospholipase family protein [Bacteroidales bacterium OttesenSCG-928-K03]